MRRKRFSPRTVNSTEFELDLAPLLAVMVKLVPVLLISSAFVQIMVIETDLPQAVKEALARPDGATTPQITLELSKKDGIKISILDHQKQNVETVANLADGTVDLSTLQTALVKVKTQYPQVFRLALRSNSDVTYREIVKVMDEARKVKDKTVHFPVFDAQKNETTETDFMFPDVVFANVMES